MRQSFRSLFLFACVALVSAAIAGLPARASYLPSVKIGTAALIAPAVADSFYGSSTTATDGLAGLTGQATPVAPEIVELARALKNNPDLIYQYVRNNIETEWMYGLSKGALGASIDKSGTAFDQAALMVALLRQAQITASFQAGTISLTAQQFGAWSGLIHSLGVDGSGHQTFFVDATAACQFLAAGGIPGTVESTQDCTTLSGDLPTTGTPVTMAHVWVLATIAGSASHGCSAANVCTFDPSFKTHNFRLGFAQTAVAMTSGDPLTAATTDMDSGSQSSVPYAHNLNESALATKLALYASNYLTYIKTYSLQGNQIEDVVSGMVLTPDNSVVRASTPPYSATNTHAWTAIPDQYRIKLTLAAVESVIYAVTPPQPPTLVTLFNNAFFADEIYGRRLSVGTNFNQTEMTSLNNYNDYKVYLTLDDTVLVTKEITPFHPDSHAPVTLTMQVDHPYAANAPGDSYAGTYMDERDERPLGGQDNSIVKNVMLDTPLSIVQAWGMTGAAMLAKWSDERAMDTQLPLPLADYGSCETCDPTTVNLTGDFTREKAQASFLAQNSRATKIHAALASSLVQIHHVIGVVYADDYMDDNGLQTLPDAGKDYKIADTYTRFDIDTAISLTSTTSDAVARRAALQAIAATSAAIEGSIMGQMQDVPDTASTATRFEWGNAPPCLNLTDPNNCEDPASAPGTPNPRNFFQFLPGTAIPANWALWEGQTRLPAENTADGYGDPQRWGLQFQQALTADIAAYQAAGFTVTASQESFLGPGQRGGYMKLLNPQTFAQGPPQNPAYNFAWTKQRGGALVATKYDANGDPTEIAHDVIGMIAVGSDGSVLPTKGGGGGAQPSTGATYNPADAGDVLKSKFVDKSNALGVNLSNGSLSTDSPVNLDVGNGDFPYSLSASASWHPGVIPIVPTPGWQRADGWVPNWNNNLALSGSGMEALGVSDIREAAGAIAAFLAAQDIYKAAPSVQRDVAGVLTQSWWVHQLTGNVATVTLGASSRQFVKLADNSWIAPGPGYATLVQTGTRTATNYICPQPVHSQDPHYAMSRGWDESGLSFAVTNQHGDTQNFGYIEYKYSTDSGFLCARNLGFRLNDWTFPQGVNVHLTYTDVEQTNTPPGENPGFTWELTQVSTTFAANTTPARVINFNYDAGGTTLLGFDDGNGRSILAGQGTVPSNTDAMGKVTSFAYTLPQKTSATQRPVPYALLSTVTTPDNPGTPHTEYDYDSEGRIKQVQDAEALQVGDRAPYQFYIADGTRGERDDPLGGAYSVVYDTYGHGSRFIDELGRETDAMVDSRSRPITYTYPEGDCEGFIYDDHNNTTAYTKVDKTGACQLTVAGNHRIQTRATYDQTWNKPLTITTPNSNVTHFVYNASGNGTSLLFTATRPADAGGNIGVYKFYYDVAGKIATVSVPFTSGQSIVSSDTYDANENLLTSTLDTGTGHLNATTSYGYDSVGNVKSTTDPRGNATESLYDADRRKTDEHHHDGGLAATLNDASRTTYDAVGRDIKDESGLTFSGTNVLTWQTDKTTTYTPTSKVATVKDADNSVSTNAYDGLDRTDTITDPVGRKTHFTYDAAKQHAR